MMNFILFNVLLLAAGFLALFIFSVGVMACLAPLALISKSEHPPRALEPISKLLEEHGDAGELHKAEKIRSVVLPAYEEPSFPLEPRKEALNEPATLIPT